MSTGGIPFQCAPGGNSVQRVNMTAPLCLNGGICRQSPTNDEFYCECPPGYIHDFTIGHFKNCALPEHVWAIMTGVVSALTVLSLMVVVPVYLEVKSQIKRVIFLSLIVTVLNLLLMIANWAQHGAYEVSHVLNYLFFLMLYHMLVEMVILFATPVYVAVQRNIRRLRRIAYATEAVNAMVQLASTIALIIYARDENPAKYNLANVIFLMYFSVNLIFCSLGILNRTRHLRIRIAQMADSLDNGGNAALIAKLSNVQRRTGLLFQNNISILITFILLVIVPIVILSIGSFPGQYIFLCFLHVSIPIFSAFGGLVFKLQGDVLTLEVAPSSNNNMSRTNSKEQMNQGIVPIAADGDKSFPIVVMPQSS